MSQNSCLKSHSDRPNQYPINAPPAQSYCFEPHVNFDLSGYYYGFIGASLSENAGKWNTTEDIIIIFPKKIILAAASPDPNFVCLMADDPFRRRELKILCSSLLTPPAPPGFATGAWRRLRKPPVQKLGTKRRVARHIADGKKDTWANGFFKLRFQQPKSKTVL